jgi:hypothetical protein
MNAPATTTAPDTSSNRHRDRAGAERDANSTTGNTTIQPSTNATRRRALTTTTTSQSSLPSELRARTDRH